MSNLSSVLHPIHSFQKDLTLDIEAANELYYIHPALVLGEWSGIPILFPHVGPYLAALFQRAVQISD